ncbi:MAG: VWA domain-containing protein [Terriglobales bacterium]
MHSVGLARCRSAILIFTMLISVLCLMAAFAVAQVTSSQPAQGQVPAALNGAQPQSSSQIPSGQGTTTPQPATENSAAQQSSTPPTAQQPTTQEPTTEDPNTVGPPANDESGMFVFKQQVEEVVLQATVVDDSRRLVSNLAKNDFLVYEDGSQQPITSFRKEDVPVAVGIVIDNSGSMRDKRDKVNQAVLNLIRAINPQDQIFVVNFSRNPYLDQDFTSDINLLDRALKQVSTQGSTALYDAIVASAIHLNNNTKFDKKVLLVVTDGQDNMSQQTLQEATRRLQQNNGPTVYAIGLMGGGPQAPGRQALQSLADATGGTAFFPDTLDQVNTISRDIARDIRNQYAIAYKPRNPDTKHQYQSIRVEARAPGYGRLTVRTRTGMYGSQSPAQTAN